MNIKTLEIQERSSTHFKQNLDGINDQHSRKKKSPKIKFNGNFRKLGK